MGPFTVAEGSVKVAQMTATGFTEGADELFWSITTGGSSGADGDEFKLRLDNVLEFVYPPDFEHPTDNGGDNTYQVTVKVSNGGDTDPAEATATISVTVSDVSYTAFDSSTLAVNFDEHSHRRVATLDAGDPVVEWGVSGADSGWSLGRARPAADRVLGRDGAGDYGVGRNGLTGARDRVGLVAFWYLPSRRRCRRFRYHTVAWSPGRQR